MDRRPTSPQASIFRAGQGPLEKSHATAAIEGGLETPNREPQSTVGIQQEQMPA